MMIRGVSGWVLLAVTVAAALGSAAVGRPAAPESGPGEVSSADSLVGVFEGRTPCGALFVEFAGYQGPSCEKMKWWLALHRNPQDGSPTTYEFDGTRVTRRGTWTITRGTATQPDAIVYRLATELPQQWIAFQRVDDNVLLFLDQDLRVMVGDASWGYVLSRTR